MHGELAAGKLSAPQGLSRLFRVRRGRSSAPTLGRVLPRGCSNVKAGAGAVARVKGACSGSEARAASEERWTCSGGSGESHRPSGSRAAAVSALPL